VSSSTIDPLPQQISAVYEHMLPRQPMRFLLADDPGAGKTIMAGLLIKELLIRGELERCLIVAPGSLSEQWQDELKEKFELNFELLTRDLINATGLGNPFEQRPLLIARMDMLSRDEELQARLEQAPEWDLVVCDEMNRADRNANQQSGGKKRVNVGFALQPVLH
jgi:superfamily II DNA or RNA helicase